MEAHRILVVDDEVKMRRLLEMSLKNMGHEVVQAADGGEAIACFDEAPFDLVMTDLKMPRMDGIQLLRTLRERGEEVPVIVLTAFGTIETAVEAMKLGAADYIIRPFEMETLELAVTRALAMGAMQRENRFLRDEVARGWGEFIGRSPKMQSLYELIQQVAPARSSVLIVGETGTGKELVARAIHQASGRDGLFVPINCAAIPAELLESELFGHQKGAFTGAHRDRMGKFELANGGTIFLDELGELALDLQPKLLRVLEQRELRRVGGSKTLKVDLRVVAATRKDLRNEVDKGKFREDLYFRLNVVPIVSPPLRERREDIPLLVSHFFSKLAPPGKAPQLSDTAAAALQAHDWPGNVRELRNVIERALALNADPEHLVAPLGAQPFQMSTTSTPATVDFDPQLSFREQKDLWTEQFERRYLEWLLGRAEGNISKAARDADMDRKYLHKLIKKYDIER